MKHALNRNEFGLLSPAKPVPFRKCTVIDAVLTLPIPHRPDAPTREVGPLAPIHIHVLIEFERMKSNS